MKNINELIEECGSISAEILLNKNRKRGEVGYITPGGVKKMKARKEYLTTRISYLQTNPSPEFLKKEKDRLLNRNNIIMEGMPKIADKKTKREYEKLMDLPKIRLQLRTLNFIS